jgi:endonuclease/exonuclease/phosphatase family metal-dependent hydrolase
MPQFSLLTLNAFGLPFYIARQRLPRLVRELHQHPASVICLQEVQQNAYLSLFTRGLRRHAHHAYHPNRFAPMGGLLTASQLPLERSSFSMFQNHGHWLSLACGDRFLRKGLLAAHLQSGGQPIVVLNTHLNANYSGDWRPANYFARILREQVAQLAAWVRAQPEDAIVIVGGDFNFPRASFLYDELLAASALTDPLANDPRPTYRPFAVVPSTWALPIDFIFVRVPPGLNASVEADIVIVEDAEAPRRWQRFLTDHCALTITLTWGDDTGQFV